MARLEPRARAMLRAYREAKTSRSDGDDALWERIENSLDQGVPGLGLEAPPRPRPVWVAPVAALAVAAAAIAAIGLGASLGRPDPSTRAPVQAPDQVAPPPSAPVASPPKATATADAELSPAPAVDPLPPPADPPPRAAARPTRRAPSSAAPTTTLGPSESDVAAADTLLLETALIQRARRALQAAAPERAIAVLDEHARDFPRGQMREDRGVLRIEALCAAGKGPQARAEARQFLRSFPGSAHASRVRGLCPAR